QAIQFLLADMSTQVEAARLLVRRAAVLKDRGRSIAREAAEAKLMAAEMVVKVTSDALQIHGTSGYATDFPIERLYRDARVYPIFEGTSQIQRLPPRRPRRVWGGPWRSRSVRSACESGSGPGALRP